MSYWIKIGETITERMDIYGYEYKNNYIASVM